jgi:hypothetical protein
VIGYAPVDIQGFEFDSGGSVLFSEQAAVKIIAAHSKLKINDFMEFPLSLRIAREMYPTFREYSVENRMVRRVRFGSQAASQQFITRAAGFGQKPPFGSGKF